MKLKNLLWTIATLLLFSLPACKKLGVGDRLIFNEVNSKAKVTKTIGFFGDVCPYLYDDWHIEDSPYYGQDYDGYDFSAIFDIRVINESGAVIKTLSNENYLGKYPLYVRLPNRGESFTLEIWLYMPDYTKTIIKTITFDQNNYDNICVNGNIYDFTIGKCSYAGGNGNVLLPLWPGSQRYSTIESQ